MSYILDALRKSEQQRQRGAAPTIGAAPFPTPQTDPAGKSIRLLPALIAVVLLGIGITIGWLRPWQHESIANNIAQPPQETPALPTIAAPVVQPPAPAQVGKPAAPPPPPQQTPAKSAPTAVLPPTTPKAEVGSRNPPPNITITVHAYSPDPAERLAGINGKLLREGQEVSPGLKLERITMDGVILNDHGQHLRRSVQ